MPPLWGSGAMLMNCEDARNAANEMALVSMARDLAPADLKAVRTGIGTGLRTLHSGVLREEVPDRIAELLRQLDSKQARTAKGRRQSVNACKYRLGRLRI